MNKNIYITIDESQTIEKAQSKFNSIYPFLKIEFFKEPHIEGMGTNRKRMFEAGAIRLHDIYKNNKIGKISIEESRTVKDLESDFRDQFGIFVQVFRKSGRVWLETSVTDGWTLFEQNQEGSRFNKSVKIEKEDTNNHDIY